MIEEIWKPVIGYEGLYEVSNTGRVRSLDMYVKNGHCSYRLHKGKVLSPSKNTDGYLQVGLCCNGKYKKCLVHRLVSQAFLPNPDNLPEVNHKDEDKTNNRVENLEFCDRKYNLNYGSRQDKVRESKLKSGYWTGLSREEYIKEYYKKYYQEHKNEYNERQKEYYRKKKEQIQNNA